jgi:hypothetical protein
MQPHLYTIHAAPPVPPVNQTKKRGYWFGHLWSFVFKQFTLLINRIRTVASLAHVSASFSKTREGDRQQNISLSKTKVVSSQQQFSTKQFKKENKPEANEIEEELFLNTLFDQISEDETNDGIGNEPLASSFSDKPNETDKLLTAEQKLMNETPLPEENQNAVDGNLDLSSTSASRQELKGNSASAVKVETQDISPPKQEPSHDEASSSSENLSPKGSDTNQSQFQAKFEGRRRIRRKDKTVSPASSLKPADPVSIKTPPQPAKKKAIIIDAGGAGNCQLLSFLKGMEMQYPHLTKYQENGVSVEYTAQKLRTIGVDFAREQLDKCGPYVEQVSGYTDSDRKEHNEVIKLQASSYQASYIKEKTDLEKLLQTKKIKQEEYNKQLQALRDKHIKLVEYLEAHKISTDEEFLNRLQQDGFFCSTLHLFALSVKFELPIYVHEKNGVKGHDVQMFNPTDSQKSPIRLYRIGNVHYKLILIQPE